MKARKEIPRRVQGIERGQRSLRRARTRQWTGPPDRDRPENVADLARRECQHDRTGEASSHVTGHEGHARHNHVPAQVEPHRPRHRRHCAIHRCNQLQAAGQEFSTRVAAWTLYPEPDIPSNFCGNNLNYQRRVLGPGFDGLRAGDPNAIVVAPGTNDPGNIRSFIVDPSTGLLVRNINHFSGDYYGSVSEIEDKIRRAVAQTFAGSNGFVLDSFWFTETGFVALHNNGCDSYTSTNPGGDLTTVMSYCIYGGGIGNSLCDKVFAFETSDRFKTNYPGHCPNGSPCSGAVDCGGQTCSGINIQCDWGLLRADGSIKNRLSQFVQPWLAADGCSPSNSGCCRE
jgi:hypothetical protein